VEEGADGAGIKEDLANEKEEKLQDLRLLGREGRIRSKARTLQKGEASCRNGGKISFEGKGSNEGAKGEIVSKKPEGGKGTGEEEGQLK